MSWFPDKANEMSPIPKLSSFIGKFRGVSNMGPLIVVIFTFSDKSGRFPFFKIYNFFVVKFSDI